MSLAVCTIRAIDNYGLFKPEFRVVTSGFTPVVPPLFFNYDDETADFLSRLIQRRQSDGRWLQVTVVTSPYDILAERFVLHATHLIPSIVGENVYLFWSRFHSSSSPIDLFREFRNFLGETWVRESGNPYPHELSVLTFDDVEALQPENLRTAIRSLFLRLASARAIVVVECVDSPSESSLRDVVAFFDALAQAEIAVSISLIFVGAAPSLRRVVRDYNAVVTSLDRLPDDWRRIFTRGGGDDAPREGNARVTSVPEAVLRLVLPLSALQCGATRHVVSYIENHLPQSDREVGGFLRKHLVLPLLNGGLSLTAAGFTIADHARRRSTQIHDYDAFVSGGARLLSFVTPENLLQASTLDALKQYATENFRLVDTTAALVRPPNGEMPHAIRLAADMAEEIRKHRIIFDTSNELHHKTLIAYLSQLLIRPRYRLDFVFFRYLEALTLGLGEYLLERDDASSSGAYEASRMLTNLGFVFDHLAERPPASLQIRDGIYARGAQLLSDAKPQTPVDIANFGYVEAWQRLSAGDRATAIGVFLSTARRLLPTDVETVDFVRDRMPIDLLAIAYVLNEYEIPDPALRLALEVWVQKSGIFRALSDLRAFLSDGDGSMDLGASYFGAHPRVVLYFCRYDFPEALQFAQYLLFDSGIVPRLQVVRPGQKLRLYNDRRLLHVIVGAPDTPDGVGEFISSIRPTAAYLYQLKSTIDFTDIDRIEHAGFDILTVSGSGAFTGLDVWRAFWRRRRLPIEGDSMEGFVLGSLLSTVLTSAGTRLSTLFIDTLVDKVKAKLSTSNTADKAIESDLQDFRNSLQSFPQRGGKAVSSAELVTSFSLKEKSPAVATSIGAVLQPGGIAEVFADVFSSAEAIGSDVREFRSVVDGVLKIATKVPFVRTLTIDEELALQEFQTAFRGFRSQADELARKYDAVSRVDHEALDDLVIRFCNSCRRFAGLLRDVETNPI